MNKNSVEFRSLGDSGADFYSLPLEKVGFSTETSGNFNVLKILRLGYCRVEFN